MTTFFLTCAALGGGVLVVQLVLSLLGLADHHAHIPGAGHDLHEGLDLFSVRTLAAGLAFFGVGGLASAALVGGWLAIPVALVLGGALGFGAMLGVAAATRAMLKFEDDGTVRIESAVGVSGDVYLTIPAGRAGLGKVHVAVQNRLMEYPAVTPHGSSLPTGARILVVDIAAPDTLVVVPDPLTLPNEAAHASR
jgi:hypothetical protein